MGQPGEKCGWSLLMTAFKLINFGSLLFLLFSTALIAESVDDKIEEKERELIDLQSRIDEITTKLNSSVQHRQTLIDQLRITELQIGRSTRKLRELKETLDRLRTHIAILKGNRRLQKAELEVQRKELIRQLRAAYAMGRQEQLKILLNQENTALLSRVMAYYDYFNRARTERIIITKKVLNALRNTEQEIAQESELLSQLLMQEQKEQQRLGKVNNARLLVITALDSEIQGKGDELQELKRNEQKLQSLVKELQEEQLIALSLETGGDIPFKELKGALKWPTSGRLINSYGTIKTVGIKWDGVMISAPEGQEVRSVHHGRVAFADWLRGFGLLLIIDHGDGYMTLYGHNQSLFKEIGEWVEPGETVALVGRSGGRGSAGVYFGIRYNGRPVNPQVWCRKPKGSRVG